MNHHRNTTKKTHARDFKTQYSINFENEIAVDLFAGGGGASTGYEMGTGRRVDVAINHDEDAISMHTANHPGTKHFISDVYDVDPVEACAGQPVGHLHASPDCTHHSQAGGGQPRERAIRSLSWIVHKWVGKVRPRVITLENVEQILQWSPLIAKRCKKTGRVIKLDRSVAAPGVASMRNMSFAMTIAPFRARTKSVTRRFGWSNLKPGDRVMGVEKGMGLKPGEKVVRLGAIEIVSVRTEPLNDITQEDCILEGFPDMTPEQFVAMLVAHYRCEPDKMVNRIEYRYL